MSINIRPATAADAETIYSFICALAEFEAAADRVRTTPELIGKQLQSETPPFECLLVEEKGTAQGFALFFCNYSTWEGTQGLYLEDLFINPSERGKGYGKALFLRLAQMAQERGYSRFEWAALNWNSTAIDFYKSFGAQALDEWTTFRLSESGLSKAAAKAAVTTAPASA